MAFSHLSGWSYISPLLFCGDNRQPRGEKFLGRTIGADATKLVPHRYVTKRRQKKEGDKDWASLQSNAQNAYEMKH